MLLVDLVLVISGVFAVINIINDIKIILKGE